jgi:hypothetical protein
MESSFGYHEKIFTAGRSGATPDRQDGKPEDGKKALQGSIMEGYLALRWKEERSSRGLWGLPGLKRRIYLDSLDNRIQTGFNAGGIERRG